MALINLLSIDNFRAVRRFPPRTISQEVLSTIRDLHEIDEMEPWLQGILFDTNDTPHGPSEIVDILTHRVTVQGRSGMAAFILKGRSFPTVRPTHVAHQIIRLERIRGLNFAFFVASGRKKVVMRTEITDENNLILRTLGIKIPPILLEENVVE
jgi:hypothetical protein